TSSLRRQARARWRCAAGRCAGGSEWALHELTKEDAAGPRCALGCSTLPPTSRRPCSACTRSTRTSRSHGRSRTACRRSCTTWRSGCTWTRSARLVSASHAARDRVLLDGRPLARRVARRYRAQCRIAALIVAVVVEEEDDDGTLSIGVVQHQDLGRGD